MLDRMEQLMDIRRVFLITVFIIGLIMQSEYPKHSWALGYFSCLAMGGLMAFN